jgi:hypothetical protein
VLFSLEKTPPSGAAINQNNGMFSWTPTNIQGGKSYIFDVVANLGSLSDRQSITIIVNDSINSEPVKVPIKEPDPITEPTKEPTKDPKLASFVVTERDTQSYVDR